jgi:hypothetical protein
MYKLIQLFHGTTHLLSIRCHLTQTGLDRLALGLDSRGDLHRASCEPTPAHSPEPSILLHRVFGRRLPFFAAAASRVLACIRTCVFRRRQSSVAIGWHLYVDCSCYADYQKKEVETAHLEELRPHDDSELKPISRKSSFFIFVSYTLTLDV